MFKIHPPWRTKFKLKSCPVGRNGYRGYCSLANIVIETHKKQQNFLSGAITPYLVAKMRWAEAYCTFLRLPLLHLLLPFPATAAPFTCRSFHLPLPLLFPATATLLLLLFLFKLSDQ